MEKNKLYFLGRKQGYSIHKFIPSKVENRRRDEINGLNEVNNLERTHFINKANILFFRNKPEKTTDLQVKLLSKRISKIDSKLIINNIKSFYNYDSKDRSFKIWKENNLLCPDYIAFSNEEINNDTNTTIDRLYDFYKNSLEIN